MATLTIQISDKDKALFVQLAKRLNAKIITTDEENEKSPNAVTIKAISDAREGKTYKIDDIDAFFNSI